MAETEVENILREIRERVVAQQRASQDLSARSLTKGSNGAGEPGSSQSLELRDEIEPQTANSLSLIDSYLTTTARAWDRLPPLVSNRSGFIARLELWLKRQLKRATHWFTWEQVNFNASVHHALRDLLPVIFAQEQELLKLRAQIAQAEARGNEELTELRTDFEAHRRATEDQKNQGDTQLAKLAGEMRERARLIQEEQRVCFKQLALETSEAAVLEDRARRKMEALLAELQRRVSQLEKTDGA